MGGYRPPQSWRRRWWTRRRFLRFTVKFSCWLVEASGWLYQHSHQWSHNFPTPSRYRGLNHQRPLVLQLYLQPVPSFRRIAIIRAIWWQNLELRPPLAGWWDDWQAQHVWDAVPRVLLLLLPCFLTTCATVIIIGCLESFLLPLGVGKVFRILGRLDNGLETSLLSLVD